MGVDAAGGEGGALAARPGDRRAVRRLRRISDERNDEPVLHLYEAETAREGEIATGFDVEVEEIDSGWPSAGSTTR